MRTHCRVQRPAYIFSRGDLTQISTNGTIGAVGVVWSLSVVRFAAGSYNTERRA